MTPARRRSSGARRRRSSGGLVLICWRDIPAQINCGSGPDRVQHMLPRRFQRAIDRAAMIAGKTQASQYVGEWQRREIPAEGGDDGDPESAASAAAAALEEAFTRERLDEFVKAGGWDPERTEQNPSIGQPSADQPSTSQPSTSQPSTSQPDNDHKGDAA
ncbi:MAG: virulence factor [Acidimicrobiaceae bacterium]|nr:virulence factor [Acidimicrobiaceae bacterium]